MGICCSCAFSDPVQEEPAAVFHEDHHTVILRPTNHILALEIREKTIVNQISKFTLTLVRT